MHGCGLELTTRAEQAELPGRTAELKHQDLLHAESSADTWRIVEAFSRTGAPFELELGWASGSGSGAMAKVTVARSARICVFARSLRIRAANLSGSKNRVGVTVADGQAATVNQWETVGSIPDQGVPVGVEVPPFAQRMGVEVSDPVQLSALSIRIYDGLGTLRSVVAGNAQPEGGVPVGGAGFVEVLGAITNFRVVFTLAL